MNKEDYLKKINYDLNVKCVVCSNCTGCYDCFSCDNCESCEECDNCDNCKKCKECGSCDKCTDCIGCSYCINCSGKENEKFMIDNIQFSEGEYYRLLNNDKLKQDKLNRNIFTIVAICFVVFSIACYFYAR